jgi:putative membrane protein
MTLVLLIIAIVFAALAALLHVYIFVMESILWTRPSIWKRFGLKSQADAETIKPMAFNQGFYNLFLALGVFGGFILLLVFPNHHSAGLVLIFGACLSMLAAAVVLVSSNRRMFRAAATQGLFPLLAVIALAVLGVTIVLHQA